MNTKEINGSAWPTSYFGIVAGPLTAVSVLLPVMALPLLLMLEQLGLWSAFRRLFDHWSFRLRYSYQYRKVARETARMTAI